MQGFSLCGKPKIYQYFATEKLCIDILRTEERSVLEAEPNAKVAVLYATAYLYEHREEADHKALTLSLRALLSGSRKEAF